MFQAKSQKGTPLCVRALLGTKTVMRKMQRGMEIIMKKIKRKRLLLLIVTFLTAAFSLCGCKGDGEAVYDSNNDADGEQRNQAMGKYAESEVALPEGVAFDSVVNFLNGPDGEPILVTRKVDHGVAEFTGYILSEDLTWEEKDCGWLNQFEPPADGSINVSCGENDKLYAVYSESENQDLISRHHVVVAEDWENGRQIEMPILSETNEDGYAYFPRQITALENGNLLFDSGSSIYLYDAAGQKKIAEISDHGTSYFIHANQFYVIDEDSKSMILYSGEDGAEKESYPLELENYYGVKALADKNGDISLESIEGIQILKNGSDIWEEIVEGKRSTMGSPKYYAVGFARGTQNDYFVYYNSMDETCKLSHYVYYPDMPSEPETELAIFSLQDNSTIRQAVSEFQIENPNVSIDFQVMMGDGGGAIADDYIKALNTELLAGEGPDILILDGMPEDSYIEKGVLEDLSDEIEALITSGDFLPNIAEGSRVDGKIYAVPVRIGLPMTFGRKEALNEAGQLSSLAALIQQNGDGQIFGTVDRETFISLYADVFFNNIVNEEGVVQEQELKDFLVQMKLILDGNKISDGTRENRATGIWGLLDKGTQLYSYEVKGFFEAESGTSIVEMAQGELEADVISLNQTYIPYGIIGINKNGENKEIAIEFLKKALSEDIQRSDFYDGFAVNQNALEYLTGIERSSGDAYGGPIDGTDGRTYNMDITWPSEALRQKLVEFCKEAKYSAGANLQLKQILLEHSENYFDGTASIEDTVNELSNKISIYLKE